MACRPGPVQLSQAAASPQHRAAERLGQPVVLGAGDGGPAENSRVEHAQVEVAAVALHPGYAPPVDGRRPYRVGGAPSVARRRQCPGDCTKGHDISAYNLGQRVGEPGTRAACICGARGVNGPRRRGYRTGLEGGQLLDERPAFKWSTFGVSNTRAADPPDCTPTTASARAVWPESLCRQVCSPTSPCRPCLGVRQDHQREPLERHPGGSVHLLSGRMVRRPRGSGDL